ncbi:MAG TPA: DMT family transporter [Cyclobacteriaceae bacterium]|nr:DMT family transporter [Cyclobacteriaceae bacterium]
MENKNRPLAIFLLLILSMIWGTSFILMKRGLVAFEPAEVASLRVTIAGVILLPLALFKMKEINASHPAKLFLSGMLGVFIPAFLFTTAQRHIDSSIAGILNTLSPLWTMIVGALFFNMVFKRSAVLGVLIGLVGTVLLMISHSGGQVAGFNWYGLLIVVACMCYGLNLNFIKFNIPEVRSLTLTSVSISLVAPLAALYLFGFTNFIEKLDTVPGAWKALGFIALLALMSTVVAGFIFNKLVKITTPLFASTVTYILPIVSVGWGVLDGEQLYSSHFIGMAAIVGGVYLANRKS